MAELVVRQDELAVTVGPRENGRLRGSGSGIEEKALRRTGAASSAGQSGRGTCLGCVLGTAGKDGYPQHQEERADERDL